MIEAARAGDWSKYLSCFGGPLRAKLDQETGGKAVPALVSALQSSLSTLKGFATHPQPSPAAAPPNTAELVVELIHADHNQRQPLTLQRFGRDWKIIASADSEWLMPKIRYGTLAN